LGKILIFNFYNLISGETGMQREFLVVLLIAVLFSVQDATLTKASSVYDESLDIYVSFSNMTYGSIFWFTVSIPDGPFRASEFTSEPSFVSLLIISNPGLTIIRSEDYNFNYTTEVHISLNYTMLGGAGQGRVVADALKRKIENYFQVFLTYSQYLSNIALYGFGDYVYIGDVPILDKLQLEFLRQELPGLSHLFSSNLTIGDAQVRLGLEKIDGSFLWSYQVLGFAGGLFEMNFGQEYTVSLNEILNRTGIISSAAGAHSSSVYFKIFLGNNTFTFVPLGTEPEMNMTHEQSYYSFYADVTGESFYDVRLRFKVELGADPTMYAAAAVLGVFSCAVGLYLYRKRRLKSSRYRQ